MSELVVSSVDETSLTFRIRGLSYNFTTANYTYIGLTTRSFTDGIDYEPGSTFWSGRVGSSAVAETSSNSTESIEIDHGLSAGSYSIYAWIQAPNGNYYSAGVDSATVPAEYVPTEYSYYGGYGGGAAVGSNGGDGSGTYRHQEGGDGADATINGAAADYGGSASATYYGYGNGGGGGHGGGGGGGGGYNTKTGGDTAGEGGAPSDGGAGAPGCVLFYY